MTELLVSVKLSLCMLRAQTLCIASFLSGKQNTVVYVSFYSFICSLAVVIHYIWKYSFSYLEQKYLLCSKQNCATHIYPMWMRFFTAFNNAVKAV